MKAFFFTFIFQFTLLLAAGHTANAQINLNSGLIACYPFSGNANDATSNGHNGTVFGPVLTNDRFGLAGSAYQFDGVDDYIDIGSFSTFTQSDDFSISVWIKPNQVKPQTILMLQPDDFYDRFNAMAYYSHNGVSSTVWDYGNCTAGGRLMQIGTVFSPAWQHFVFTVEQGVGMKVYINGVLTNTLSTSSTITNRQRNLWIGGGWDAAGALFYFDGIIDDMRLYDRAVNGAEVQALHGLEQMCQPTALSIEEPDRGPFNIIVAHGQLHIDTESIREHGSLILYSVAGKEIYRRDLRPGGESFETSVPFTGILLYSFRTATEFFTGKLAIPD